MRLVWPLSVLLLCIATFSCDSTVKYEWNEQGGYATHTDLSHSLGQRFRVIADVNGDGRPDTLVERYIDAKSGQEIDKFILGADHDSLLIRVFGLNPVCFVSCSEIKVRPLVIGKSSFGLALLRNEGDLNGDGRDEIGWVGHWADFSNLNTYHIATWTTQGWKELAAFAIWEWQLPELPGSHREFGLAGQTDLHLIDSAPAPNADVRLVHAHSPDSIKVIGMSEEAMLDTMIIPLAPLQL